MGQPICPDCYDYPAHIAFNWHAPELWRRFTIAVRRILAHQTGLTAAEFGRRCRVSFVKVAEFQRRGVVHFHALIRLDGPGEDYQPPQIGIDATAPADAIRQAAAHVRLTVETPAGPDLVLRFGEQLDTQTVNGGPTGELTPNTLPATLPNTPRRAPSTSALASAASPPKHSPSSTSPLT